MGYSRATEVHKINSMVETEPMETLPKEIDIVVEDVAAYHFAKRLGLKIWMTWFMLFPDELHNAGGLTPWLRWKFSCVHLVMKNKAAMLEAYESKVLGDRIREDYRRAIEIT